MPPKAHRAGATGLPRTHSRSSSGGSSKAALNLHFTQKDPAPAKQAERTKKNGLVHDPHSRNTSPYPPRVNSSTRLASREQLPVQAQRQTTGKPKAGFTIASQSADEDEEWVSSESGAATPSSVSSDSGRSRTPVETHKHSLPAAPLIDEPIHRPETPRAQLPSMSRVPTIRPPEAPARTSSAVAVSAVHVSPAPALATSRYHVKQSSISQHPSPERRIMETRSENTSPIHRSRPHKRQSVTRPPSTHSTASRNDAPLRPHPLIRGQSYGHAAPVTPRTVPLAPLTITSEAAPAHISTTQIYDAEDGICTSPSSIKTTCAPPPNRKTSISSARSVVTLPTEAHIQPLHFKAVHDRTRTLSSMSSTSSSSVQALSSLAQLPTTRPSTPQYTSHFPAASLYTNLETVHPLLPPPYLSAHVSILAHRSPLRESYDRVIAAKEQQRRRESA
ncbi:uncharacterized protein BJ212DRAFT_1481050 [Suillus subaureus]|uniref:Uncharacterized protein n=1 Tax=Suillus subaureus TaxID=48587 RepID=A0A9P7JDH3_9AGAM|nr:uncharacterized protein BJ212DRAFT_1481050 [Suillus subaureus]KAG1815985.1 hypothetical protein BJ212DRAFT_1481050 [Suillus subaureus]